MNLIDIPADVCINFLRSRLTLNKRQKNFYLYHTKKMKQRHKYEYNLDLNSRTAPAAVVRMVGKDKRVLEIGAGPGSIARVLKEYSGCSITAIEIDEEAIEKLSPFCEHVYRYDLNDNAWVSHLSKGGKFDVVVAADVLEHLFDPWATLNAVKSILDSDGEVVVSLPHIGHSAVIACLLQEDLQFQDWGLLDKTHIRFFGIENMQRLFDDAGFKIIEAEFIVLPPEQTELAHQWRNLPAELRQSLLYNQFGEVYQVVIKAKATPSSRRGLRLSSLSVPTPVSAISKHLTLESKVICSIKEHILPYLSPHLRTRIRNILYKFGLKF